MRLLKKIDLIALVVLIGVIFGLLGETWQIYRARRINLAIANPETIAIEDYSPIEVVFAKAAHLARNGQIQDALRLYNSIEGRATPKEFEKIKFNMGRLYLTEAARYWNQQGVWAYSEVLTWSTLAQKAFRDVLIENPSNWDARFNLEYALRISPPPREVEKADWTGHKSSVHSIYPGIPGGGP